MKNQGNPSVNVRFSGFSRKKWFDFVGCIAWLLTVKLVTFEIDTSNSVPTLKMSSNDISVDSEDQSKDIDKTTTDKEESPIVSFPKLITKNCGCFLLVFKFPCQLNEYISFHSRKTNYMLANVMAWNHVISGTRS